MWMLLERVRFTLDSIECNKIGVSYEAFNRQPNFCSSPFWTCLHNQLWNFREVGTAIMIFCLRVCLLLINVKFSILGKGDIGRYPITLYKVWAFQFA